MSSLPENPLEYRVSLMEVHNSSVTASSIQKIKKTEFSWMLDFHGSSILLKLYN